MRKWRALYVASRQEKKVAELISLKGIDTYLPLIKTMRKWSDRKKLVEFPLLPGYVFVFVSLAEQLACLQTKGVVNFVKSHGKIGLVHQSEIEALRQLVALGYHLESFPGARKITLGNKIKITSGVLKNFEGSIIEEQEKKFFLVSLESIGQNIKVRLPEGVLIPI